MSQEKAFNPRQVEIICFINIINSVASQAISEFPTRRC